MTIRTPSPAPPPQNGADLLAEVERFHRRFNVFPSEAAYVAVTLWDVHAHLLDAFESTPRLAFLSPEPGSGKTRALEVVEMLVPRSMTTTDASHSALFRSLSGGEGRPTILFDEIDTIFGPKAAGNEDLRGLINAGHRRTGGIYRCVGDGSNQVVQKFPVYAALAVGGLGDLPDTIMSRAIIVRMRRRAPNEKVEAYRQRIHEPQGHALRDRIAAWADSIRERIDGAFPDMPEGVNDRPADVWEPLLAVADIAGGTWPARARAACVELINAAKANDKGSTGIRLLTDLRDVFGGADRLPTATIIERLTEMDDAPWADLDGRPMTTRTLGKMLGDYVTADNEPIKSRSIKFNGVGAKGYYAADLMDAWTRYCPPPSQVAVTAVTGVTAQVRALFPVTDERPVTDTDPSPAPAHAAGPA